jgi:hypothetical protein
VSLSRLPSPRSLHPLPPPSPGTPPMNPMIDAEEPHGHRAWTRPQLRLARCPRCLPLPHRDLPRTLPCRALVARAQRREPAFTSRTAIPPASGGLVRAGWKEVAHGIKRTKGFHCGFHPISNVWKPTLNRFVPHEMFFFSLLLDTCKSSISADVVLYLMYMKFL